MIGNGVEPVFTRGGPGGRRRLRARGRDARAAQEPPPARRSCGARLGVELRVVGARGLGRASRRRGWLGEVSDEELAALYRGARCARLSVALRGLRHSRCSRRWPAARRWSPAAAARRRRSPAARRCSSTRSTSSAIAAGIEEAAARRVELRASGSSGRSRHVAVGGGRRRGRLAGARVTPLVVVDADVLGRRRTGDETYVLNLLRELAPLDPRPGFGSPPSRGSPSSFRTASRPSSSGASQELRMALTLPRLLRRLGAALAHFQYALPLALPCPAVVTIHDLSFEREPSLMGRGPASCSGRSCRARRARPRASSPSPSVRGATCASSTAFRTRRSS